MCGVPAAPVQYDCSVAIAATIEYHGMRRDVQIQVDMRGYQVDQSSVKIDISTTSVLPMHLLAVLNHLISVVL